MNSHTSGVLVCNKRGPRPKSSCDITRTQSVLPGRNISRELLRSITDDPLGSITFLDLSFSGIHRINGLFYCPNIEVVILHGNCIDFLPDFRRCKQLWKIDLSCNRLKNLNGFEYFTSLGTLVLCENKLDWNELLKIRHLQITNLSLIGNEKLTRDQHYRKHVIVNLPSIWCLDGDVVTAKERSCVDKFFQSTIKSQNPAWSKLPSRQHVPTFMQASTNTAFGKRAIALSKCFGKNETHTKALDSKRLLFLSKDLNEDMSIEFPKLVIQDLLANLFGSRQGMPDKCNMLLLLLTSSLLFSVPTSLMKLALAISNLEMIGSVACEEIFNLPLQVKTTIVFLLLGHVKLERDDGAENGISTLLYSTLKALNTVLVKVAYGSKDVLVDSQLHNVIASELVKVFCLIPNFSEFLQEASVLEIIASATKNREIEHEIGIILDATSPCCTGKALIELITSQIEKAKTDQPMPCLTISCRKNTKVIQHSRKTSCSYDLDSAERKMRTRPSTAPAFIGASFSNPDFKTQSRRKHSIGDKVLLSPQRVGHIIAIPDADVILVQVDTLPPSKYLQSDFLRSSDSNDNALCYINAGSVIWERKRNMWVVKDTLSTNKNSEHYDCPSTLEENKRGAYSREILSRESNNYPLVSVSQKKTSQPISGKFSTNDTIEKHSFTGRDDNKSNRIQEEKREFPPAVGRSQQWKNSDYTQLLALSNRFSNNKLQPNELTCFKIEPC